MGTVAGLTGLSRIAGFVRDILTAAILGAGPVADAFFVALKLPNFFRRVTAEGAFSVSFVPLYSEMLETEGREAADRFANNIFAWMAALLSFFSILAIAAMPYILYVIAPGFGDDPIRYDLAVNLSRITFPYLLFMSLTALLGGVLNTHGRYAPFAFAPVLFNLALIIALLCNDFFETAGHALAYGVLAAGVTQFFFLIISALHCNFKIKIQRPAITPNVKKVLHLMGPGVIGAGVMHINLFADLILASFLQAGAISYLYYADRLNQLPLGVVGIAVGTALLPMLSKALAAKKMEEARTLFQNALEYCLVLALPAAVALFVIPVPLIQALFERGEFDAGDTAQTAGVLMGYAIGLPAYIAIKVFSTAHWARQDTMTPVKISVIATVLNIALSIALIQVMGVAGIALATGLTAWVQFAGHCYFLRDHPAVGFGRAFWIRVMKIILCSGLMGVLLYSMAQIIKAYDNDIALNDIVSLAVLVLAGLISYFFCIFATRTFSIQSFKTFIKGRKTR